MRASLVIGFSMVLTLGFAPAYSVLAESYFPYAATSDIDLDALNRGEVIGKRVDIKAYQLSLCAETYFMLPTTPDRVLKKLRYTGPNTGSRSGGTFGIDGRDKISKPASLSDFSQFALGQERGSFGFGGSAMADLKLKQLNLSKGESANLQKASAEGPAQLESAWKKLFLERVRSFQSGGLMKAAPYETGDQPFRHQPKTVLILKSRPNVLRNFQNIIGAIMTGSKTSSGLPLVYGWESTKVQVEQTVTLNCIAAEPNKRGGYLIAESAFYVSNKYYTSMILHELIPVNYNGKSQTLCWRGDFVITSSINFLKGVERLAAQKIMLIEVKNSVQDFVDQCRQEYPSGNDLSFVSPVNLTN
ncbi:MAG: hypothetical protein AAF558_14755 [Verrucomicrobiota bacterium]